MHVRWSSLAPPRCVVLKLFVGMRGRRGCFVRRIAGSGRPSAGEPCCAVSGDY